MTEKHAESVSRRGIFTGGLAAGALAGTGLLTGAAPAVGAERPGIPGLPTARRQRADGPVARVAPALDPAWQYLTFGPTAFHTWVYGATPQYTSDPNGLHASTGATLIAPVALPQGAVIQEVTFWVYNASASTGLSVGLANWTPPAMTTGGNFSFTTPGAGAHTITLNPPFLASPVDNTKNSYALSSYLEGGGTFGLQGARIAYQPGLVLTSVDPVRKLDTRKAGPLKGKIASGRTKTFSLTPELPAGAAKSALINLTVTETESYGGLNVYAGGGTKPTTPAISWKGATTLTNSTIVPVSPTGDVSVTCGGPQTAKTHVVVDLIGYLS